MFFIIFFKRISKFIGDPEIKGLFEKWQLVKNFREKISIEVLIVGRFALVWSLEIL